MDTKMIGDKIAKARKGVNISQAQLAERLFISPQAVGKWERGESIPDLITFNRLAEILGVDLNYFSESFPSVNGEAASPRPPAEQPSKEPENKRGWDMSSFSWVDADFSGLKNLHERFSASNMQRCKFIGSDMSGLLLKSNSINGCDFSGSDISGSQIQNSEMHNNVFQDCSLKGAELSGNDMKGCNFSGADLSSATVKYCDFRKNTMTNAVLKGTTFNGSSISDIVFEGVLQDCSFENCSFSRVTFQNTKLMNTFFKSPNLKRIRFIDCQADRMTYEFLKNGKADLSGITLLPA